MLQVIGEVGLKRSSNNIAIWLAKHGIASGGEAAEATSQVSKRAEVTSDDNAVALETLGTCTASQNLCDIESWLSAKRRRVGLTPCTAIGTCMDIDTLRIRCCVRDEAPSEPATEELKSLTDAWKQWS